MDFAVSESVSTQDVHRPSEIKMTKVGGREHTL